MHALLLIDLQNDFLPGGPLAVAGGDEVVEVANAAMAAGSDFGVDRIVATQDWHPRDHGSFASQHESVEIGQQFELDGLPQIAWPDHCVQQTRGALFADALRTHQIDHVARKGCNRLIDSYSGFFDNGHRQATTLHQYLTAAGITDLTVMGLATDYCVKFTVLDAIELGYRVRVALSGCRGVNLNPGDVDAAIDQMSLAGAKMVAAPFPLN